MFKYVVAGYVAILAGWSAGYGQLDPQGWVDDLLGRWPNIRSHSPLSYQTWKGYSIKLLPRWRGLGKPDSFVAWCIDNPSCKLTFTLKPRGNQRWKDRRRYAYKLLSPLGGEIQGAILPAGYMRYVSGRDYDYRNGRRFVAEGFIFTMKHIIRYSYDFPTDTRLEKQIVTEANWAANLFGSGKIVK